MRRPADQEMAVRTTANVYWRIFKAIEGADRPSTSEVARMTGLEIGEVRERLKSLISSGFIYPDGYDKHWGRRRGFERTWSAQNAYGAEMLAKRFPAPRGFQASADVD